MARVPYGSTMSRRALPGIVLLLALTASGCSGSDGAAAPAPSPTTGPSASTGSDRPTTRPTRTRTPKPSASTSPSQSVAPEPFGGRTVLAISVDGLNPDALRRLGPDGAPAIWRLLDEGLATLDARTSYEKTVTLPNHVGMVTGRGVDPAAGGHGVTWNSEIPGRTVQGAAGEPVDSIFTNVHEAGGSTAVFAGKSKFRLFEDSWPDAVDDLVVDTRLDTLLDSAVAALADDGPTFTFVHVLEPDATGHRDGFMSADYLRAVQRADAAVGRLLDAIGPGTVVILTADHGGLGAGHSDQTKAADYTVPFVVWGPGVAPGDLYDASPDLADPGTARPTYDGAQPVRNCDLADVASSVLLLDAVPGSTCDANGEIAPLG